GIRDDLVTGVQTCALPISDESRRLAIALHEVAELADPLYASLPQQVTHGDFGFGNLLLRDGTVIGYLDFEHSGWDVRAMDLAVEIGRASCRERVWNAVGGG